MVALSARLFLARLLRPRAPAPALERAEPLGRSIAIRTSSDAARSGTMMAPAWRPLPRTRDGVMEYVRDDDDAAVATWLRARGVRYRYEGSVGFLRPTFLLEEHAVVLEWAHRFGSPKQQAERSAAYARAGCRLVLLERAPTEDALARAIEPLLAR